MDHSIKIYKNVITSELCDELVSLHQKHKDTPSIKKTIYGDGENTQTYVFKIDKCSEYDRKIHQVIDGIVNRLQKDYEYFPHELSDSGYELREVYGATKIHTDGLFSNQKESGGRLLSVIIALTDDYDGGVFNFPYQSYQVKLNRCEAIIFPPTPFYPHEVSSPKNGKRYTICTWLLEDPSKFRGHRRLKSLIANKEFSYGEG